MALVEILDNRKYLWNDARTRCSTRRIEDTPLKKRKSDDQEETETPVRSPKAARRAKTKARNKLALKEAKALKKQTAAGGATGGAPGGGAPGGSAPGGGSQAAAKPAASGSGKMIPTAEFKKITAAKYTGDRRCNFFNSSVGCKTASCKFAHECVFCGEGSRHGG